MCLETNNNVRFKPSDRLRHVRTITDRGLDPSMYRSGRQYTQDDGDHGGESVGCELPPQERFRGCAPFKYTCPVPECGTSVVVDAPFRQSSGGRPEPFLLKCPNPKCPAPPLHHLVALSNSLTRQLRAHLKSYYDGWLLCEDPGCTNRCRRTPLLFVRGFPVCNVCGKGVLLREYTESQLYKQLCFLDYILDFQKACATLKDDRIRDDELRRSYAVLRAEVQKVLARSAYSHVDLRVLFANLLVKKY
ncbi:Zinc finger DNA-directed DNA polymerase family B alpha [Trinorchestia longiramus]|nr:Zinc finger DNA-directed DNA polymerase family B alpha [Trinorchestia longiramus]